MNNVPFPGITLHPRPPRQNWRYFINWACIWPAQLIKKGIVSLLCPKTTCTCTFKFWLLCIPIIYKILTCEQHLGHLCFFSQESDLETVQLQVFSNMIFSRLSRCEWAKVADQSLIRVLSGYHSLGWYLISRRYNFQICAL